MILNGMKLITAVGAGLFIGDMLMHLSIFGIKTTATTVKATYNVAKTTASIATDVFIKKPIYLLSYPFRRHS